MDERTRSRLDVDMANLADGNRSAFTPVFRALWPVLQTFCKRALRNDADAEDAAQLALEKIFSQAASYDPKRSVLPWALTIATWECATLRRRRQRVRAGPPSQEVPSDSPTQEDQLIAEDLKTALDAAVRELSDADRATLDASFVDDTVKQASSPAMRKRKERALDRLRSLWSKLYEP